MIATSERKLLFIASGGSSGTHLLARILSDYPPLRAGPELAVFHDRGLLQAQTYRPAMIKSFLNQGEEWSRRLSNGDHQDFIPKTILMNRDFYGWHSPADLQWLVHHTESLPDLFDQIHVRLQERRGWPEDAVLIEHAPMSALWLKQVAGVFPCCRIVHLVRDMRDAVASMAVRRAMRPPIAGLPLRENVEVTVDQWVAFNAGALEMQNDFRYLRIGYEDLVNNTNDIITRVLTHVFDMTEHSAIRSKVMGVDDLGFSVQPGWLSSPHQTVSTRSIGRYVELLDPAAIGALFDRKVQLPGGSSLTRAGDMQSLFGYPTSVI